MGARSFLLTCLVCSVAACGGDSTPADLGTTDAAVDSGAVDAPATTCRTASDCEDTLFCNGTASCAPGTAGADARGCVAGAPPCAAGQTCDEPGRVCLSDCDLHGDADRDGHAAIACGGDDCDDTDPNRYPGNPEVCDTTGRDEDCDPTTLGPDRDGDGFVSTSCCNAVGGGAPTCGTDCDDTSHDISPTAPEVCDGVDDDCNGLIDEGVTTTFYRDLDGDRYGDTTMIRTGCSAPVGYVLLPGDCNDTDPLIHPGVTDVCNTIDDDCDGNTDPGCVCTLGTTQPCGARDATGALLDTGACHPGTQACVLGAWGSCVGSVVPQAESCNLVDDDCDGMTDEAVQLTFFADSDGDHYGTPATTMLACAPPPGYVLTPGDCDDTRPDVHQGAPEVCDGFDNNCDGRVDEGVLLAFYRDADGDTYGVTSMSVLACSAPTGYVARSGDCNDASAAIHPGVTDICDGIDNDCDGVENPTCACTNGTTRGCGYADGMGGFLMVGPCHPGLQTCTAGSWGACVGNVDPVAETCNGADDDCNGTVDNGVLLSYYRDCDNDGYGAAGSPPTTGCMMPGTPPSCGAMTGHWVLNATDCNDAAVSIFPGGTEVCNGADDDCDTVIDGAPATSSCNSPAPRNTASGATCSLGRCTYACAPTYLDCDTTPATYGCEVASATDATNCGACGHVCSVGTCGGSACTREPVSVVANAGTTCVRRRGGGVLCWGNNGSGELGDGTTADKWSPYDVPTITNAVQVSVSDRYVCAVLGTGGVVCWGANELGQCGTGSVSPIVATPTAVVGLSDAVQVAAGGTFACALRVSGAVVCWGSPGMFGSLGDGSTMPRLTPTAVSGLTDATEVAAAGSTGLARRVDGTVVFWGDRGWAADGSGVGSSTPATSPVSVPGVAGAQQLVVEGSSACVRTATSVLCWGNQAEGRLGNGMAAGGLRTPGAVTGLTNATRLAAANGGAVAILSDQTAVAWGQAYCGNGDAYYHPTLVVVGPAGSPLTNVVAVAGGGGGASSGGGCALTTAGLSCWGANDHGQVGDGTTTTRDLPTSVTIPP